MRYWIVLFLWCSNASWAQTRPAEPVEHRAVEVSFFGGITGFDDGAYRALKAALASLLVDGLLDHFITTGRGLEGGSSFCVQLNDDVNSTLDPVMAVLHAIRPVDQSVYRFEKVESCLRR